jgi:hypothetical protein
MFGNVLKAVGYDRRITEEELTWYFFLISTAGEFIFIPRTRF